MSSRPLIGIVGGTFNPIHYGHLRPALELQQALGFSQTRFVPCADPPHRPAPEVSAQQRLAWVQAAIAGQAGFLADDRELRRAGKSYMVDTLRSLAEDLPQSNLCLVLGTDAFAGLASWDRWPQLLQLAHIVVAQRPVARQGHVQRVEPPSSNFEADIEQLLHAHEVDSPQALSQQQHGCIYRYPVKALDISSTHIRTELAARRSVRFLLPDTVLADIERQACYTHNEHDF